MPDIRMLLPAVGLSVALLAGCANLERGEGIEDLRRQAEAMLGGDASSGALTGDEIVRGLKAALETGSNTVVARLGSDGGFSGDPRVRVPLPRALAEARDYASRVGLEGRFDALELRLNEAAEAATPQARALFIDAIRAMSVDDARAILDGPDDAATQYFRDRTGADLATAMRPLVDDALSDVGAVRAFDQLLERYRRIPLAPEIDADLTGHVVDEGIDGIFLYLAEEERAIRENPLKRTSEILRRVFGAT